MFNNFSYIVEDVEIDMEGQKLTITTDKSAEDCLEALKKTGKATDYIGEVKA
jgi:hydrogenase maturation factor